MNENQKYKMIKKLVGYAGETVYALDLLPQHQISCKKFDLAIDLAIALASPKKHYIPPMCHPWKQDSFERYLKKQASKQQKTA